MALAPARKPVPRLRSTRRSVSSQGTEYIWTEDLKKSRLKHLSRRKYSVQGKKNLTAYRVRAAFNRSGHMVPNHDPGFLWTWQVHCAVVALRLAELGRRVARRAGKQNRLKICLLTQHPMVLKELQQLLTRPGIQTKSHKLVSLNVLAEPQLTVPRADVFVIDAHGPRPLLEKISSAIEGSSPNSRVLFLVDHFDRRSAIFLLRLGGRGLLRHEDAREQLPRALRVVASGGYWVPRTLLSSFVDSVFRTGQNSRLPVWSAHLSRREKQVLDGLLSNLSNKEIAAKLNIAPATVKYHVGSIMSKFHVRRRADLIVLAYQQRAS